MAEKNEESRLSVPENPGDRAAWYINMVIQMASYVVDRAAMGGITQEQIIAQFELNVRKCMAPDWKLN